MKKEGERVSTDFLSADDLSALAPRATAPPFPFIGKSAPRFSDQSELQKSTKMGNFPRDLNLSG